MKKLEIKAGQILLVHSHNPTGRVIQFGMKVRNYRIWLYDWIKYPFTKKKPVKPKWKIQVFNHAGIGIGDNKTSEALAKGITNKDINDIYGNSKNKVLRIYEIPNITDEQIEHIKVISEDYKGVNYQFVNFLQYVPEVFFGIWLGKTHKSAEDKLYCTEYVGMILWRVFHIKKFKKYWRTCPSDTQEYCESNLKLVKEYIL